MWNMIPASNFPVCRSYKQTIKQTVAYLNVSWVIELDMDFRQMALMLVSKHFLGNKLYIQVVQLIWA